jgi:hypothetical protein
MSSASDLIAESLGEQGDEPTFAQGFEWVIKKKNKDKLNRKGIRTVVVGKYGFYVFNGKKVRAGYRLKTAVCHILKTCRCASCMLICCSDSNAIQPVGYGADC